MSNANELPPPVAEPAGHSDGFLKRWVESLRRQRDAIVDLLSFKANPLRSLAAVGACLVAVFVFAWIADKLFAYFTARSYVQQVAEVFDLNQHLANAIVYVAFVVLVFLGGMTLSLSKQRRLIGIFGTIGLLIGHSLILWWGTSKEIISHKGDALKCYVITRDGVRYGERAGIDPGTGRQCRPVTPELVERLREYEKGNRPRLIADGQPTFFNQGTGEPIVWYSKTKGGDIELFDLMGFHPSSGEELVPVSRAVVDAWTIQKQQEARKPPEPIDPEKYAFFDPITGKPRVWYRRAESGGFEFYDREGFHPRTGEALAAITRETIDAWQQQKRDTDSQKCYVITRDAVRYGSKPGIDNVTGRECRLVTAEILERLREYEKGNRPKPIKSSDPTFFDLRTGEPIVWHYKAKNGNIEIFDLMGFHPESGEELLPITRDVVEAWRALQKSANVRAPKPIDPEKYAFFDPVTGNARVWFWRSEKGDYEFYDAPGYQPRTGDPLTVVTKDALEQLRRDSQAREKKLEEDRQKIEREKRERTEKMEREAREIAKKQEEEARTREAERQRETQAANLCDQMAGNPSDPGRSGIGATFDALKNQAKEAAGNCEQAVRQYPNELRFQYQLARSLQFIDRNKAFDMLRKLASARYPAAYDNLGWMLYADKKNVPEAVSVFRAGVRLGDPDSMVSVAEMIDRGHITPVDQSETKIALYARAAALGHQSAQRALQIEQAKEAKAAQDLATQQQQQQRMMLEVLGTVIQNVRR